ncbi:MAG: hypothetical protein WCY09_01595 [Candidatus Omnitrophota bacterium]|jgi:hypothetical protein
MEEVKQPEIKPVPEINLKFTPGAYKFMQETFRKHREFLHKLNPLIKDDLLKDIKEILSVINSAEKAGKRGNNAK